MRHSFLSRKFKIAALFLLLVSGAQAGREGLDGVDPMSYDWAQVGGGVLDLDVANDVELSEFRGMYSLGHDLYLLGDVSHARSSNLDLTITQAGIALGTHGSLGRDFDYFFDVGYLHVNSTDAGSVENFDGPKVSLGLRGASAAGLFELELRYTHGWDLDSFSGIQDLGWMRAEILWRTTQRIGIYTAAEWVTSEDAAPGNSLLLGLRINL
ncbi:MAG: hypothetical protein ABGY71_06780 [bacterium]|nr:hypothetical protein [Planctomycetota bacterium]HIL51956.1 hypothetical protein [Planctomycetota bacterium]